MFNVPTETKLKCTYMEQNNKMEVNEIIQNFPLVSSVLCCLTKKEFKIHTFRKQLIILERSF